MNTPRETGSALVSVLSIITILTILVGIMLSAETMQYRFIGNNTRQLQARYTAEAGVFSALRLLRVDPLNEFLDSTLVPAQGLKSNVSVEVFGGYYLVKSEAIEGEQKTVLLATVGERPPEIFRRAVYLWDRDSHLNIAGATVINGDIEVGRKGIRQRTLKGARFTGELNGVSVYNPEIQPAYFDDRLLKRSIGRFEHILGNGTEDNVASPQSPPLLPGHFPVFFADGDLHVTAADSSLLSKPVIVAVSGNLILEGPIRFANRSHFLAGDQIILRGVVTGEHGIFYGRHAVNTMGVTESKGQFISLGEISVRDSSYLAYPSMLFLAGSETGSTGNIEISGISQVNGSVIHDTMSEQLSDVRGRVLVGSEAIVRGSIFNPYETEIHGILYGSLVTHRLFFYKSPTRYINWLWDATIDVNYRPEGFILPLMFSVNPEYEVLSWEVFSSPWPADSMKVSA